MTLLHFQKIKVFNQDIVKLVEGEEAVKDKETRLYNKLREEFKNWALVLAAKTQQGKSWDRAAPQSNVLFTKARAAPGT